MSKKDKKNEEANVHEHLKGFDISIDEFGEMQSNIAIDRLNTFLDKNVEDKKLLNTLEEE